MGIIWVKLKERQWEGTKQRKIRKKNGNKKLLFWNIADLGGKDREIWDYIENFDYVSLCETWIDEQGWEKLKGWLPNTHEWKCNFAVRVKRKGRNNN